MKKLPDEFYKRVFTSDENDICFMCGHKMIPQPTGELECPNCDNSLYSWEYDEALSDWEQKVLVELGYFEDDSYDSIPEGCAADGAARRRGPSCQTANSAGFPHRNRDDRRVPHPRRSSLGA